MITKLYEFGSHHHCTWLKNIPDNAAHRSRYKINNVDGFPTGTHARTQSKNLENLAHTFRSRHAPCTQHVSTYRRLIGDHPMRKDGGIYAS